MRDCFLCGILCFLLLSLLSCYVKKTGQHSKVTGLQGDAGHLKPNGAGCRQGGTVGVSSNAPVLYSTYNSSYLVLLKDRKSVV